jgi:hypothetical protein
VVADPAHLGLVLWERSAPGLGLHRGVWWKKSGGEVCGIVKLVLKEINGRGRRKIEAPTTGNVDWVVVRGGGGVLLKVIVSSCMSVVVVWV